MERTFFISYARIDAKDFVAQLNLELTQARLGKVWQDTKNIKRSDFVKEIEAAIKNCSVFLYVITPGSRDSVFCQNELIKAIESEKEIIPLLVDPSMKGDLPLLVARLDYIDFSGYVRLASLEEEALERLIERVKSIIEPEIGKIDTASFSQSIETSPSTTGAVPDYFQGRNIELQAIGDFFSDDAKRILIVYGRSGIGKTTLVRKWLSEQELDYLPEFLGQREPTRLVDIHQWIAKLNSTAQVANFSEDEIINYEADPKQRIINLAEKLQQSIVMIIDDFHLSLDEFDVCPADIDTVMAGLCRIEKTKLVILTQTIPNLPRATLYDDPVWLELNSGLTEDEVRSMFQLLDRDGKTGMNNLDGDLISKIVDDTDGNPLLLERIYDARLSKPDDPFEMYISSNEYKRLIQDWIGGVFASLTDEEQTILKIVAVFNIVDEMPVHGLHHTLAMLKKPRRLAYPNIMNNLLERLTRTTILRKTSTIDQYKLQNADRDYILSRIPATEDTSEIELTLPNLCRVAADFYREMRAPVDEWQSIIALRTHLMEFELRCRSGDYDDAFSIITDKHERRNFTERVSISDLLYRWGEHSQLRELHEKLEGKLITPPKEIDNLIQLATAKRWGGQLDSSLDDFETALEWTEKVSEYRLKLLGLRGNTYMISGDLDTAIQFHEEALELARQSGSINDEIFNLRELGQCYEEKGNITEALRYNDLASEKIAINTHRAGALMNRGNYLVKQGKYSEAADLYMEAEHLYEQREGKSRGWCFVQYRLGYLFLREGNKQGARERCLGALPIADQLELEAAQNEARYVLGLVYLDEGNFDRADNVIDVALQFGHPRYVQNVYVVRGIVALQNYNVLQASTMFTKAIEASDHKLGLCDENLDAWDMKGLALTGLILCEGQNNNYKQQVIQAFETARKLNKDKGIVDFIESLFDSLDIENQFSEIKGIALGM